MNLRGLLFISVLSCVAIGCRRDAYFDAYVETLNAEKRALEDEIYELQFDYEALCRDLEACRNGTSKDADRDRTGTRDNTIPRPSKLDRKKASQELDEKSLLEPPKVETGTPTEVLRDSSLRDSSAGPRIVEPAPENRLSARATSPPSSISPVEADESSPAESLPSNVDSPEPPAILEKPENHAAANRPESPTAKWVTQIVVHAAQTGGANFDEKPGDDGITVLVEPRNAVGEFVSQAAPISLVLLDPTRSGEDARVQRWDFDVDETRTALQAGKQGILLKANWNGRPPDNNHLVLFVRYETIDGRKLEAKREITLSSPSDFSHRWTPRGPINQANPSGEQRTIEPHDSGQLTPVDTEALPAPAARPVTQQKESAPPELLDVPAPVRSTTQAETSENAVNRVANWKEDRIPRRPQRTLWKPYR